MWAASRIPAADRVDAAPALEGALRARCDAHPARRAAVVDGDRAFWRWIVGRQPVIHRQNEGEGHGRYPRGVTMCPSTMRVALFPTSTMLVMPTDAASSA